MALGREEIEKRFGTTMQEDVDNPHFALRATFKRMAQILDEELPDGRAKSVAFTHLEDASMWSHKAIANAQVESQKTVRRSDELLG